MFNKMITLLILLTVLGLAACSSQPVSESASVEVEEPAALIELEPTVETVSVPTDDTTDIEVEESAVIELEPTTEAISAATENTTYAVETAVSTIGWLGEKIVGDAQSGNIDVLEGVLIVEEGALVSGTIVIDMTTIASDSDRLVIHLKSDDFFNVDTYPTASIDLLSAEPLGADAYAVTGNLTIKGIGNPIEFVVQAVEEDGTITASSDIVLDRTLYDVVYKSGSFFSGLGDGAINDDVQITVALVAAS